MLQYGKVCTRLSTHFANYFPGKTTFPCISLDRLQWAVSNQAVTWNQNIFQILLTNLRWYVTRYRRHETRSIRTSWTKTNLDKVNKKKKVWERSIPAEIQLTAENTATMYLCFLCGDNTNNSFLCFLLF